MRAEGLSLRHSVHLPFTWGGGAGACCLAAAMIVLPTMPDARSAEAQSGLTESAAGRAAARPGDVNPRNTPSLQLAPPDGQVPDEKVQALANDLSLESRRYILYLYARMNRPHVAEALAERILKENPGDQRTLLVMASMYVERKDAAKALATAKTLTRLYPDDDQSLYFLGAAYFIASRFDQAEAVWKGLKTKKFVGRQFPYESDLASAALKSGDWFRAKLSYEELLRNHKIRQPLRLESRQVLETIYRAHLPQLRAYSTANILNNGSLWRPGAEYRQHVEDRQTVFAMFEQTLVDLHAAPGLKASSASYSQGVFGLDSVWRKVWQTSIWAGGSEAGPMGGAKLTRSLGDQNELALEIVGSERVSDGLLMETLNGRQHRATASFVYAFRRNFTAAMQVTGRQVSVEDEVFGQGLILNTTLDYTLKRGWPEWHAGWRSYWSEFQQDTEDTTLVDPIAPDGASQASRLGLLGQLILPSLHREGIYANVRHQLSGFLYLRGTAGIDYSFDRSAMEYYGQGGFAVYPRKRLELQCGVGYSSSARSADQSSDQWLLDFGLKYWF